MKSIQTILFWMICCVYCVRGSWGPEEALQQHKQESKHLRGQGNVVAAAQSPPYVPDPILLQSLTRDSRVIITADARGNLGPPSVVCQREPGTDWLRDRWQAASDMGGTAIPGAHWLLVDLGRTVTGVHTAVIDWEAAFANKYTLSVRNDKPPPLLSAGTEGGNRDGWVVMFDGAADVLLPIAQRRRAPAENFGQSPGVKDRPTPMHVVHTITKRSEDNALPPFRYLLLAIQKPAAGWGVSLWQLDLLGGDGDLKTFPMPPPPPPSLNDERGAVSTIPLGDHREQRGSIHSREDSGSYKISGGSDAKGGDTFRVQFDVETAAGPGSFVVAVRAGWAPVGARHFRELVENKFYDGCRFFRVLPKFMVQFGISGDPAVSRVTNKALIKDDPVLHSNLPGTLSFAMRGPHTRTTQLFVNYVDNARLDREGFAPFGEVEGGPQGAGMAVLRSIYNCKELPDQGKIQNHGNTYLNTAFPDLSSITRAFVLPGI